MSRMKRDVDLIQMQVNSEDHDFLLSKKYGSAEQLDAVLHRILEEYKTSDLAAAIFMFEEQVKTTQSWMKRYRECKEKLDARNHTLDEVTSE